MNKTFQLLLFSLVSSYLASSSVSFADWLDTPHGFQIREEHPRVATTPGNLNTILERMHGPQSREPYERWFELVKNREDTNNSVSLCNLALIYLATGDSAYLTKLIARWPTSGDPSINELYALDLVFDELPDSIKLNIMARVSSNTNCWYYNSVNQSNASDANWGYHSATGVYRALAYAGIFALTDLEVNKDPNLYRFDCLNYLGLVHEEMSPAGYFYRIERRIAGDPTSNDALAGSFGGMYDNFGYDRGEEAASIHVINEYENLTGLDRADAFLHDKYRGTFYQNFQYPHKYTSFENDQWAHRGGTEIHTQARIWFTQTDSSMPNKEAVALTAARYQDSRMQDYAVNGFDIELTAYDFDLAFWHLMYFDDSLATEPPHTNPTAYYASGPGLVSMRSDWSNDAAFAVFTCGEGISRRYEDANSFILHRKVDVIPIAGARIRFNADNNKHHWFHIRSAAKNTMKIYDPEECQDRDSENAGRRGPLHSGPPLVASDNFGGQMFETAISTTNNEFKMGPGVQSTSQSNGLSYTEMGNVIKYEHVPGEYTYTVGDATEAYTRKIDYFQREFLYLRPDVFVVFDRLKTVNPDFKKVWTIHTVDEPVATGESEIQMGYKSASVSRSISMSNPENITYIDTVFPKLNTVKIRGGDTILIKGNSLNSTQGIHGEDILETDIPRWLELFAIGSDTEGVVTISGETETGPGDSEDIDFVYSKTQNYVWSSPSSMTSTTLQDTSQNWEPNQWTGYVMRTRSGSGSEDVLITGNNANTLFIDGGYTTQGVWGYIVLRQVGNTTKKWKKITSISTSNMNLSDLVVSVPHYFDTEDAFGNVYSFSPNTDGVADQYSKSKDIGQWTIEIEATEPSREDVFLNVISLKDPGVQRPKVEAVSGDMVSGAVIDDMFVVFAHGTKTLEEFSFKVSKNGEVEGMIFNLKPHSTYFYSIKGGTITVSLNSRGTYQGTTTAMGVLKMNVTLAGRSSIVPMLLLQMLSEN